MAHALFPPSAASRWLACPYSVKMAPLYPDTSGEAAKAGTHMHAVAEDRLRTGADHDDSRLQLYLTNVRDEPGILFVEHRVTVVPGYCWGTADAVVIGERKLTLFDLKWGKSMVHATGNPQLLTYGCGVLRENPMPRDTEVELVIVQPNATTGWPVKRWNTDVQTILDFRPKVLAAIDAGLGPDPKAVPGTHCYWCPAKPHCRAYLQQQGAARKK